MLNLGAYLRQQRDAALAKLAGSLRSVVQRASGSSGLSDRRYRAVLDTLDDGFCVIEVQFDEHGTPVDYLFLETNAAFERHTGLVGAVGQRMRKLVPHHDTFWFEFYGRVVKTGEPARAENQAAAMGRWFDAYAIRLDPPHLNQCAAVFKDTSERKRIDAQREQLLRIESEARKQAEEASRLKDDFLATVSHELRTPLHAMLGWVHLLRGDSLSPERRERALATVERNARVQAQLIEDLLDVSRILSGKLWLQREPVLVDVVVEAAVETVRPLAYKKNIELLIEHASDMRVLADPHRLQQIVWNLLTNAVKFTPEGGRIELTLQEREGAVELLIHDSGQGIAAEFLPHVFERFRQQDGGSARAQGGLGLGLSIVQQLVALHEGEIAVHSDGPGRGATFTLRLPAAPPDRSVSSAPAALLAHDDTSAGMRDAAFLKGLRVVVVDDQEDAREMLRTMLEDCGANVRTAASGCEALSLFDAAPPDLLISDLGMPDQDGFSFIQRVRELSPASGGEVPAIALTAYARSEDRTLALIRGFSTHMAKPVDPRELLDIIQSLAPQAQPA